jgi:hypothetical protein
MMWFAGAVPVVYADMATAYPDLFKTAEAARKAFDRLKPRNPGQTPIDRFLIGLCPGFRSCSYRRVGMRGPERVLIYDANKVDPAGWLRAKFGDVKISLG